MFLDVVVLDVPGAGGTQGGLPLLLKGVGAIGEGFVRVELGKNEGGRCDPDVK